MDLQTLYTAAFPHDGPIENDAQFSCFMIDRRLFEQVGEFDEQFAPCYHEDTDMRYRIRLNELMMMRTSAARYFHFDRISLRSALAEENTEQLISLFTSTEDNLQRYVRKWGGIPGRETFRVEYENAQTERVGAP